MKRLVFAITLCLLLITSLAHADLLNGSFESGLAGWDVRIDTGFSEFITPGQPVPGGSIEVVSSRIARTGDQFTETTRPTDGQYFADVSTGNTFFLPCSGCTYTTSLRQEITLEKSQLLSGSVAFRNADYMPQDTAWVRIYSLSGTELANPFYAISTTGTLGTVTVNGQTAYVEYLDTSDWETWLWTAPDSGRYILELGMQSFGDNRFATETFFDNIRVGVPEPSAMLLFACGLFGIAGVRRFKKR